MALVVGNTFRKADFIAVHVGIVSSPALVALIGRLSKAADSNLAMATMPFLDIGLEGPITPLAAIVPSIHDAPLLPLF